MSPCSGRPRLPGPALPRDQLPQDPVGDRFPGLDGLLQLMGSQGLKIYASRPSPLVRAGRHRGGDDVVVVKINYQWPERGGTNTDLLRGLIRVIVDHPDGFAGEVVVCENTQFADADDFDRTRNNAQDHGLSPRDCRPLPGLGQQVSLFDWTALRSIEVQEYSQGDATNGYVVYRTMTRSTAGSPTPSSEARMAPTSA